VVCGCFKGSFAKFKKEVKESYPDNKNIYRKQYEKVIKQVKALWSIK
jgi:ABC-type Zn uptake system ZnuABC Zn-binding protein ZnuA